jgi:hypothetical protein
MTEEALLDAERALQLAQFESDVEAMAELLHNDLRFLSPSGIVVGKDDDLKLHSSGELKFLMSNTLRTEVFVKDGSGMSFATIELEVDSDGEKVRGTYAYTRHWIFQDDRWQMIYGAVVPTV